MARPQKKGLDYFPHDTDMSDGQEMAKIEAVYGNDGYAVYNKILEKIYKNGFKIFISDEATLTYYSKKCNINDNKKLEEIINFLVIEKFFDKKLWEGARMLTSSRIKKTFKVVSNKRVKSKEYQKKKVIEAITTQ